MLRVFMLALVLVCAWARSAAGQAKVTSFKVNLTWDAPVSSPDPVAGYNAYRAPTGSTSFQQISTGLVVPTNYSDLTPQPATSYDYVVESVDAEGVTSSNSNTATVPVPALPAALSKPTVKVNPPATITASASAPTCPDGNTCGYIFSCATCTNSTVCPTPGNPGPGPYTAIQTPATALSSPNHTGSAPATGVYLACTVQVVYTNLTPAWTGPPSEASTAQLVPAVEPTHPTSLGRSQP
jgi:hypothetical protein